MCVAFALGKLQFGHVFGRCAGHMLFIFLLFILYCDRFVVAGAPWNRGPLQQDGCLPGVPCHRGTSATLGFTCYVELFWFWAGLILVFFCKMCAAFAVGKLHFSHVCCICACVLHCVLCGMLMCVCFGKVWFWFCFRMCAAFALGTLHFCICWAGVLDTYCSCFCWFVFVICL